MDSTISWREVSKDEFFATVGKMNVHPQIQPPEKYPYWSLWKTPRGQIMGKSVGQNIPGDPLCDSLYYVPNNNEGSV